MATDGEATPRSADPTIAITAGDAPQSTIVPVNSRKTVSSNGGTRVRWSRDGSELFYVEGDDTLMVVEVSTAGDFSASPPTPLFEHPSLNAASN